MQMSLALEKGSRRHKSLYCALIIALLLPTHHTPDRMASWALKRGFVRIQQDFLNVFTINFQTQDFLKVPRVLHTILPSVTARFLFWKMLKGMPFHQRNVSEEILLSGPASSLRGIFKRVSDAAGLWGVWLGVAREVRVGGLGGV